MNLKTTTYTQTTIYDFFEIPRVTQKIINFIRFLIVFLFSLFNKSTIVTTVKKTINKFKQLRIKVDKTFNFLFCEVV
jgi:hypothetical protein